MKYEERKWAGRWKILSFGALSLVLLAAQIPPGQSSLQSRRTQFDNPLNIFRSIQRLFNFKLSNLQSTTCSISLIWTLDKTIVTILNYNELIYKFYTWKAVILFAMAEWVWGGETKYWARLLGESLGWMYSVWRELHDVNQRATESMSQ